jgi:dUTP pyrophosphatase
MTLQVSVQKVGHGIDLDLPVYQTPDSAGMDLRAAIGDGARALKAGMHMLVPAGIAIALPSGYEAQVRPRSGLAMKHGVTVLNAPGTIDADYRGEIGVLLINHGASDFDITHGMRIAQLVIAPVSQAIWSLEDDLSRTRRAAGGFGSTGT